MKYRIPVFLVLLFAAISVSAQLEHSQKKAIEWVNRSISVMGGHHWKELSSLKYSGSGNGYAIEQSERPEGPYIPVQLRKAAVIDYKNKQAQITKSSGFYTQGGTVSYVLNEDATAMKFRNGMYFPVAKGNMIEDDITLSPELVLFEALASKQLQYKKDTLFQEVPHAIIAFLYKEQYPIRLFINQETDFLSGVEVTKPYTGDMLEIWGDLRKLTLYSFWNLLNKDLHYPLQSDVFINNWHYASFLINNWEINVATNRDSLLIPDSIKTKITTLVSSQNESYVQSLNTRSKEVAPGIWILPGPCNATVIEQPDGIILIEPNLSSEYGAILLKKAQALFPNKPIKAVVSTSDAWLHFGGLRTFAAIPKINIYHPKRNGKILSALLKAPYRTVTDNLSGIKQPNYNMIAVEDSLAVGNGANRLIFYTFKTESGERMMMTYFPEHGLVYASDLFQPKGRDGKYFQPHYTWEVIQAFKKRKLNVKKLYGMHTTVTDFSSIENDFK